MPLSLGGIEETGDSVFGEAAVLGAMLASVRESTATRDLVAPLCVLCPRPRSSRGLLAFLVAHVGGTLEVTRWVLLPSLQLREGRARRMLEVKYGE